MYEWGNFENGSAINASLGDNVLPLAKCAYRWRTQVSKTGKRAFEGWRIVLAADGARSEGYVRLLKAGGANILADK